MSPFIFVAAAVSYLSVCADFFVLEELDGLFHIKSACVCSVCLSVCVFVSLVCVLVSMSRKMSALHRFICV